MKEGVKNTGRERSMVSSNKIKIYNSNKNDLIRMKIPDKGHTEYGRG